MKLRRKLYQINESVNRRKLLIIILSLAVVLRFFGLSWVPGLDYDSTIYMMKANDIIHHVDTPLIGSQIYFGPFFFYLLASLGSMFGVSIFLSRFILAIIGVLTVVMAYLVGKKYFSEMVGLIAAVLVAVSPWQIAHSRLIWEVNFVPLFVLIVLYLLMKSLKRAYLVPMVGFFLGMAFQSHPTSILVAPIIFAFYFINRRKILYSKLFLLALVLFILAYFPILLFNFKNGFTMFDYFSKSFSNSDQTINFSSRFNFVMQLIKENLSGPWRFTNPDMSPLFLDNILHMPTLYVIWIVSLVFLLYKFSKSKKILLFANVFFLLALPFVSLSKGLYSHYLMFFMPFLFLAVSVLLSTLISDIFKNKFRYIIIIFLFLLVTQNVIYIADNYFRFYYEVGGTGYFETHKCCKEEVAKIIRQSTDNTVKIIFEDDINLFVPVSFYLHNYSYVVLQNCDKETFANNSSKIVYVFNYNSLCDQNFKAFSPSSKAQIVKSPSGETNVFSIYLT